MILQLSGIRLNAFIASFVLMFTVACNEQSKKENVVENIGTGQMPCITTDRSGNLYVVYGSGDSIFYTSSGEAGKGYSQPELVAVLPGLAASAMRGPQIAATTDGIIVTACNKPGDIFLYNKEKKGKWLPAYKLNDADTVAKEGLMALHADGDRAFAVWLDLRNGHNQIFGSGSADGGKTWTKNKQIYASPDMTVCECCKPSVYVKDKHVYVMFRNWLHDNRDLYLIQSDDSGLTFGTAQKLGTGNWPLTGCPMDGGAIAVQDNGVVQTVWRRQNKIYSCEPGQPEKEIGEGKGCTLALVKNEPVYTWTEKGEIICKLPSTAQKKIGKGRSQMIKQAGTNKLVCVWENENKIYSQIINL